MNNPQKHDVSIIFDGDFGELLDYLRNKGMVIALINNGVQGSSPAIIVGGDEDGE